MSVEIITPINCDTSRRKTPSDAKAQLTPITKKTNGNNINEYAKVIRQTVGYFVYDPQTDKVFDPLNENIFELDLYQSMTDQVEKMKTEEIEKSNKRPWWKFW